jgi:hypothetical protein
MRHLPALAMCSLLLTASPAAATPAAVPRDGGPRIRTQDARLTELLQSGLQRSTTMRTLVARIEAGDVIVYIGFNPLMRSGLAGSLTWMTRAGDYRYLRAAISPELTPDQMVATIAHELQHAAEVIDDPTVVNQRALTELYKRIGHPSRSVIASAYETIAAQEMGLQVRRELVAAALASSATKTLESGQM